MADISESLLGLVPTVVSGGLLIFMTEKFLPEEFPKLEHASLLDKEYPKLSELV